MVRSRGEEANNDEQPWRHFFRTEDCRKTRKTTMSRPDGVNHLITKIGTSVSRHSKNDVVQLKLYNAQLEMITTEALNYIGKDRFCSKAVETFRKWLILCGML